MSILSDRDIIKSKKTGSIVISEFSENNLTPDGYDLHISEIFISRVGDVQKNGTVSIPSGTMFYVSTIEKIKMPNDICAQLWLKTCWIRKGVIASFGKIDAGFEGTLTLGDYNATDESINISIGEKFCQIVFEALTSASQKNYKERSGHYKGQTSITLEPIR